MKIKNNCLFPMSYVLTQHFLLLLSEQGFNVYAKGSSSQLRDLFTPYRGVRVRTPTVT